MEPKKHCLQYRIYPPLQLPCTQALPRSFTVGLPAHFVWPRSAGRSVGRSANVILLVCAIIWGPPQGGYSIGESPRDHSGHCITFLL